MEESLENKLDFKNKLINFYNSHKVKIIILIFVLIFVSIFLIFWKIEKKKIIH